MKLGLVTDSTSDIPQYLIEQYGIEAVPCLLVMDGREYIDGQGLSRSEFYRLLPELRPPPTTAAPSIGEFSLRYQRLLDEGCDHIVSIHAAGALTSIVDAARQAAAEFDTRVTVVDSRSISLGLGFQVLAAAEAAQDGLQMMLAAVESTRRQLHLIAVLQTLEYARRSGRLPTTLSVLGGLLHISPLIELSGGEIKAIGAIRTMKQANERMAAFFRSSGPVQRLAILHASAEERAREFLQRIMQDSSQSLPREILMVNVNTVIGAHVGPNAFGFAAVKASATA